MKKWVFDKKIWSRRLFLITYDTLAIITAGFLALLSRFNFYFSEIEPRFLDMFWHYLPYVVVGTIGIFFILRLYHSLWAYAGLSEMQNIVSACVLSAVMQIAIILLTGGYMPRSYYFLYLFVCQIAFVMA